MITAIDTNILIDILDPDPVFGRASGEALKQALLEGAVVACDVVWAEVATAYGEKQDELLEIMDRLNITFSEHSKEASLQSALHWFQYRQRGGRKTRIAADFLIGGHALVQCDRLLTRDNGFFRDYFHDLKLLVPDAQETNT